MAELASAASGGLLALAVGTGLQVLQAMLEEDVARLVGPEGRHNPDRVTVHHGSRGFSDTDALRCAAPCDTGSVGRSMPRPWPLRRHDPDGEVKEGTREENYA